MKATEVAVLWVLSSLLHLAYGGSLDCSQVRENEPFQTVGCIGDSLVPKDQSYWVEFKEEESNQNINLCLQTCQTAYPNTSLALISWDQQKSTLDCRCALPDAIKDSYVGPQVFCDAKCSHSAKKQETYSCGGRHQFSSGTQETFFNVYCLVSEVSNATTSHPTTLSTTSMTSTSTTWVASSTTSKPSEPDPENDKGLLRAILASLVRANVSSIIMIALMVIVIFMVLLLILWIHYFVQNFELAPNSRFYRRRSEAEVEAGRGGNQLPSINVGEADKSNRGGAENKAFDPSPEAQLHGEFHNLPPDFARRAEHTFEQNGFSSFDDEDEEEESVTPRASESDFVLHEGRSTFYSDSKEEETTEEAAKDTISTSSTQKLEDELEDKPENDDDVFEDATLKLDENGKGKKPSLTS